MVDRLAYPIIDQACACTRHSEHHHKPVSYKKGERQISPGSLRSYEHTSGQASARSIARFEEKTEFDRGFARRYHISEVLKTSTDADADADTDECIW